MAMETVGIIVIAAVFILMFLRVPIVLSMALPAFVAILYLRSENTLFTAIESVIWEKSYHYTLSTIPLFVLMGQLLFAAGFTADLFDTFRKFFGRIRGGLGMATIAASAVFASSSGSSLATTSTIGLVASKEMLKSNYSKALTGGTIVAGGTLGILIPPSTMFIIYGMITEQSIGKLLIAGIIPGLLLSLLFILTIFVCIKVKPSMAGDQLDDEVSWKEKLASLKVNIWIICLFLVVMGGIYLGFFTATEAAGVGALGAFIIALLRRKLTWKVFSEAMFGTIKTTGFIFVIVMGAFLLNYVLTITRVPNLLADFLFANDLSPFTFFLLMVIMYLILGAIMDTLAMVVVTIPILLPTLIAYDFDLIWFGVIIVLLVEVALISPPVGMNCFVLRGVVKELDLGNIFKGALIFVIPIVSLIFFLYAFPDIVTFLPNLVK